MSSETILEDLNVNIDFIGKIENLQREKAKNKRK